MLLNVILNFGVVWLGHVIMLVFAFRPHLCNLPVGSKVANWLTPLSEGYRYCVILDPTVVPSMAWLSSLIVEI